MCPEASPPVSPEVLARIRAFGLRDEDQRAWVGSGRPESEFDGWLTDRVARRPAGLRAREVYGADDVHDFARRAILEALRLGPRDRLLEVGCGGGLLLRDALAIGASATGIDHSEEMVELARERAPAATVMLGDAAELPFAADSFTAAAMSVVFFFLSDPAAALAELRRVVQRDGRVAIYTTSGILRGTPAAPEPMASRGHFYSGDELRSLATAAGLRTAAGEAGGGGPRLTPRV